MSITSSTFGKRTYKIVLLGDTSTGKTSIIDRFVNNKFEEKDNVDLISYSPLLESTSLAKISHIKAPHADCNSGIQLVNKDTAVSSQVISKMRYVPSSSSIYQVANT